MYLTWNGTSIAYNVPMHVDQRPPAIFLMGPTASGKTALACELVAAVRGVRMKDLKVPDDGWGAVLSACEDLGHSTADRDLTADLELAETLLPQLAELVP